MIEVAKMHVYEVRPRKDKRGVDLISDVLPFGRLHALRLTALCDGMPSWTPLRTFIKSD